MKITRSYRTATALGSFTAAAALLVGMSSAQAQAPTTAPPLSGAGSFPGSFIVPGTNTSLHVGGFVQLDARYDMSAFGNSVSPGADDNANPNGVELEGTGVGTPGGRSHGTFRTTAQNSRLQFETRTPSAYGEIKTFIELDFAGNQGTGADPGATASGTSTNFNQTSVARIKQAYGTMGPWLFGMTNSNFADLAAWADTIDAPVEAGGFMGAGEVKVNQVRYTYLLPNGISASGSIESNQTGGQIAGSTGAPGTNVTFNNFNSEGISQKIPALTGTVQIQQPWGHAGLHLVVADDRFDDRGAFALGAGPQAAENGSHFDRWGYQISQTGHFNTIGKDKITWQLQYGQGSSNYNWALNELGTQYEEGLVCSTNAAALAASVSFQCSQPRVMGINAGYSHWWTDTWRSGVSFGWDDVSKPNAAGAWLAPQAGGVSSALSTLEHHHTSAAGNIYWTPVAGVQLGAEYEWYHRTVWSGAHGSFNRIATQALFSF